jgi:hypothetical protein
MEEVGRPNTRAVENPRIVWVELHQVFKEDTFGKHVWLNPSQKVTTSTVIKVYKKRHPSMRLFRIVEEVRGYKHVIINELE